MARQKKSINDEDWPEVEKINSYAIFMGYLLMGVRGGAYMDHGCPPRWLRLHAEEEGFLVCHSYHTSPNCRVSFLTSLVIKSFIFVH